MNKSLFSVFICWLHKKQPLTFWFDLFAPEHAVASMWWCLCIAFFMKSSGYCPVFGLGLTEIPAHLYSWSWCWHSSSDCLLCHVAVLLILSVCFHDVVGVGQGDQVCEEYLVHSPMVRCWMVPCPIIGVVCFTWSPMTVEVMLLFAIF